MTDHDPDYVVLGETHSYNIQSITKAIQLISAGRALSPPTRTPSGPSEQGMVPACGAMAALIETASGVAPFFVGKPNPLMMRTALNFLGVHSEDTVMIGDRMDTDIVAGINAGMETILVLTGVTQAGQVDRYPYRPTHVADSIAQVPYRSKARFQSNAKLQKSGRRKAMATAVVMPKQGQTVESCIIVEWKKRPGDTVTEGDVLCEVETDKAVLEVPSPGRGDVAGAVLCRRATTCPCSRPSRPSAARAKT